MKKCYLFEIDSHSVMRIDYEKTIHSCSVSFLYGRPKNAIKVMIIVVALPIKNATHMPAFWDLIISKGTPRS